MWVIPHIQSILLFGDSPGAADPKRC